MLETTATTARLFWALVTALGTASCAQSASPPMPSPHAGDGGPEQHDAAPLDASSDLFHPSDAAASDDAAAACPSDATSLIDLDLYAPVEAAIDTCNRQPSLRTCTGEVCDWAIETCGRRVLRFDAEGCAVEFSTTFNSVALAGEAAACVVAELAASCSPCAAGLEVDAYLSCTD